MGVVQKLRINHFLMVLFLDAGRFRIAPGQKNWRRPKIQPCKRSNCFICPVRFGFLAICNFSIVVHKKHDSKSKQQEG
jgi:hypothetical protein